MDKTEAREYLNQARFFLGAEQYEDGIDSINKAIALDRMNIELYIYKSIFLANLERFDEAIEELKNALKVDRKSAEAYFHLGNLSLLKNDKQKGIEYYNKAIAYGQDDSQIYYNLGMMYEGDGDDELAIRNYSKAILKDPLRVDARVRKAQIYIANGKYPEALETLNELILADPDLYEGYHLKSILLAEMGQLSEAEQVVDEAIALFPKDPAFLIDKINLYVLNDEIDKARETIAILQQDYELDLLQKRQIELEKSRIYAIDSDIENIEAALKRAKAYSKENDEEDIDPETTFLLASCSIELGKFDEAIMYAQELINSDDLQYSIPSYYMLPYAYEQKGDAEKANELYKESISKLRAITLNNPEIADGYFFRVMCLKGLKDFEKALEICDYLLKVDSSSKQYHRLRADVLHSAGREEEALEEVKISESLS